MKTLALALLLLGSIVAGRAVEIAASGIAIPFFNEGGKLTHKLVAARGALVGAVRRLEDVEVHYFSLTAPDTIVQKITATEATWNERTEILAGHGAIVVATEETRLTGEGFDFALATSLLNIHRNFRMENREMILTSTRAKAELLVAKSGEAVQVRDVKWCEAVDNLQIVVLPTATREYAFQTAFSDLARYDGATKIVTLPHPIRAIDRRGQEARLNKMEIKTGKQAPGGR